MGRETGGLTAFFKLQKSPRSYKLTDVYKAGSCPAIFRGLIAFC